MNQQIILNTEVSYFETCKSNVPKPQPVTLIKFFTSQRYRQQIEAIRAEPDEARQKEMKATLPCATVSGTFSERKKDGLINHSGFIAIDIDMKDNRHIENYDDLKNEMAKIPFVAYCGLSVRGNGFCVVMPLAYPEKHDLQFEALKEDFAAIGIMIDHCGDVCRLRFVSYDPAPYINEEALPYSRVYEPQQPVRRTTYNHTGNDTKQDVERLINELTAKGIDITDGYENWRNIGFAFAHQFGEDGRQYFHDVSTCHVKYNYQKADKQFTNCVNSEGSGVTISTFFGLCKQVGLTVVKQPVESSAYTLAKPAPLRNTGSTHGTTGTDTQLEAVAPPAAPQPQTDIALPVTWCMPMVFNLSAELSNYQLATFQLSDGRLYDCLFDADNAFVAERESEAVKAVEQQYNKHFRSGCFYGDRCLLHILNN